MADGNSPPGYSSNDPCRVAAQTQVRAVPSAWKTFLGDSELATKPIVWSKTVHDIPDDFVSANR